MARSLLLCVILLGIGCTGIRVRTDWDREVSFEGLQRYAWLEPPRMEGADPFADNDLLRKRVRRAVVDTLGARGFREVANAERADFLVTWGVVLDEKVRVDGGTSVGVGGGYGPGYGIGLGSVFHSPSVRDYQESTLLIDVLQAETRTLVWRGWGTGVVGTRDRERSEARLRAGVQQILEAFPPREAD